MTDSPDNNFNLQQLVDKIKAMITPEKRAQMMIKIKNAWAIISEKPVNLKPDSEAKPLTEEKKILNSNINIEAKQEEIEKK